MFSAWFYRNKSTLHTTDSHPVYFCATTKWNKQTSIFPLYCHCTPDRAGVTVSVQHGSQQGVVISCLHTKSNCLSPWDAVFLISSCLAQLHASQVEVLVPLSSSLKFVTSHCEITYFLCFCQGHKTLTWNRASNFYFTLKVKKIILGNISILCIFQQRLIKYLYFLYVHI